MFWIMTSCETFKKLQAHYGNTKQVCLSLDNFRGQNPQIVKQFAADLYAFQGAEITDLKRNTINRHLTALQEQIARHCEAASRVSDEVEVDERF